MADISIRGEIFEVASSQDLTAAPFNLVTTFNTDFSVMGVLVHTDISTTQTFSVTLDSVTGSNYDVPLVSTSVNIQNFTWQPSLPWKFKKGNELIIHITNNSVLLVGTCYVTILAEQA